MSKTTLDWLHERANLIRIETRMTNLRKRYIFKAAENNNPMILDLISEYLNFKSGRNLSMNTIVYDMYGDLKIRYRQES
jgi:hypothetical protein